MAETWALVRWGTALAAVLLGACSPPVSRQPDVAIRAAWARETAPGQTGGAAYLTVVNDGDAADRLVGVASSLASMAMLHGSGARGGVVSMRMLGAIDVPAGATVLLAPLGTHIMLTGLKEPLRVGERLPLTLRFERSGTRSVAAVVVPASSAEPAP